MLNSLLQKLVKERIKSSWLQRDFFSDISSNIANLANLASKEKELISTKVVLDTGDFDMERLDSTAKVGKSINSNVNISQEKSNSLIPAKSNVLEKAEMERRVGKEDIREDTLNNNDGNNQYVVSTNRNFLNTNLESLTAYVENKVIEAEKQKSKGKEKLSILTKGGSDTQKRVNNPSTAHNHHRSISMLLLEGEISNNQQHSKSVNPFFNPIQMNTTDNLLTQDKEALQQLMSNIKDSLLVSDCSVRFVKELLPSFDSLGKEIHKFSESEFDSYAWGILCRIDFYNVLFNTTSQSLLSSSQYELLYSSNLLNLLLKVLEDLVYNKESPNWFLEESEGMTSSASFRSSEMNSCNYLNTLHLENPYLILCIIQIFTKVVSIEVPYMEKFKLRPSDRLKRILFFQWNKSEVGRSKQTGASSGINSNIGNKKDYSSNSDDDSPNSNPFTALNQDFFNSFEEDLSLKLSSVELMNKVDLYLGDEIKEVKVKIKEHINKSNLHR